MGSADDLALDILINALKGLSLDHLGIRRLVIGGINEDWPVPDRSVMDVTMDPMQYSIPDDDEEDDEEDVLEKADFR